MTSRGTGPGKSKSRQPTSLESQGLKEVMDLLKLADHSANPDIRAAAVEIARETSKHQRRQAISPSVILVFATLAIASAFVASWYALTHYPERLALEVCAIAVVLAIVAVGVYGLLSGRLSQSNFIHLLQMCLEKLPFSKRNQTPASLGGLNAQSEMEKDQREGDRDE